ncbi:MAG: DUF2061 domain-containing protein [Pseudomonadales bacterium]|nr:DUF2061 domain-containing protein [Pseudomonadales bacterium]
MNSVNKNTVGETSRKISIAKAISWRIIATLTTMAAVFVMSGEITLAIEVGAIEVIAKLLLYYFHERLWLKLSWSIKK